VQEQISTGRPEARKESPMITAIVRYKLPASIKRADCLAHFHKNGTAGGVYQWDSIEDARAFYTGPWLDGIVERYGNYPEIEYFTTFAVCDARTGEVTYTEPKATPKANAA
jgi:hypothetical protein